MSEQPRALRILTLNLRRPDDPAPNRWEDRLPLIAALIQEEGPDLVGTQEGLFLRLGDLQARLGRDRYGWLGVGREGGSASEFVAIFYRRDRLELLAFDHFWLSRTPRTIGSVLAEANPDNPRLASWGRFRERSGGREVVHVNTHFDERSPIARALEARMLADFVGPLLGAGQRVVLTGDFNAPAPTSAPYGTLTSLLDDAWTSANPGRARPATFHGFRPDRPGPGAESIDWILASRNLVAVRGEVLPRTSGSGAERTCLSDHWPVVADLVPRPGGSEDRA